MPKSKAKARAEAEAVEAKVNPKNKAKARAAEAKAAKAAEGKAAKAKAAKGKTGEEKGAAPEKSKHPTRFAVIQAQGLQFRVGPDEEHILPHLGGESGDELKIDRVLLISDGADISVGKPLVEGAVVTLQVVGHERGEKIRVGTYKRRKKYRRKIGYRDTLTRVKVLDISLPAGEKRGKHGA